MAPQYKFAPSALVTVIMPTIGRPDFVVDSVRSVLAQSYANLQVLISDNAPAVATGPLLEQANIDDVRIKIIKQASRLDFHAHMNLCIKAADGEYLMILSDDDQITPGFVEEAVTTMRSKSNVRVCLSRQIRIGAEDRGVIAQPPAGSEQRVIGGVEYLLGTLRGELVTNVLTPLSMFAKRADVLRLGGFKDYPDGSHTDNFLLFSLALEGDVALLTNVMFYRVYLDSVGMRTPFSSLLQATKAYTRDCELRAREAAAVCEVDRAALALSLRRSNSWLLLSRIRHVYARRGSPWRLPGYLREVLRFWLATV